MRIKNKMKPPGARLEEAEERNYCTGPPAYCLGQRARFPGERTNHLPRQGYIRKIKNVRSDKKRGEVVLKILLIRRFGRKAGLGDRDDPVVKYSSRVAWVGAEIIGAERGEIGSELAYGGERQGWLGGAVRGP